MRGGNDASDSANIVYISDYHRFGWLLFLALRVHAFSRFKDIVTSTNGIVSILVSCLLFVGFAFIYLSLF